MSLIVSVVAAVAGYGVATAIHKGRTKEMEALLSQKETNQKRTLNFPAKPEHEKDVLEIIQDIAYLEELERFSLVEIKNGKAKYQYYKNEVLITVLAEEDYIECQVKRKGTPVIEYIYDKDWDTYDKTTILRSVFEEYGYKKAMKVIEDFMFEVNNYDWEDIESNLQIVDDIKEVKPALFETTSSIEFQPTDGFTEMEKMKKIIEEQEINDEVGQTVLTIIRKIKKATEEIKQLDKELDIEAKHVYDELIKKDFSKLFHAYLKLDEENRLAYKEKILDGLERIENKTSEILVQVENKNLNEIDAILHVIKQRYNE